MAVYKNTFEGGTNGVAISPSGSGGASGTAIGLIVSDTVVFTGLNSSPNVIYSTAAAQSGSLGCRITLTEGNSYLLMLPASGVPMESRVYIRIKMTYPGPTSSATNTIATLLSNSGNTRTASIIIGMDGRPQLSPHSGIPIDASKSLTALTPGQKYTFIVVAGKASSGAATDGELGFRILDSGGNVIHTWTGTNSNGVTDFYGARYGGGMTNANGWTTVDIDDIELGDIASGWPPDSGETAIVLTTGLYFTADFTGSTSSGSNTLSYSIAFTSGDNQSAGIKQPVSGLFLIPQGASDSVYTVTVTDGAALTTRTVNVPAAGSQTASEGVVEYHWNGTAWV